MNVRFGVGAWALMAAVIAGTAPAVSAGTLYQGTLSTSDDTVVSFGSWDGKADSAGKSDKSKDDSKDDNGFVISYLITHDEFTNLVTYQYDIAGVEGKALSKALSHFVIETSYNFTYDNIYAGTTPGGEVRSDEVGGAKTIWDGETNEAGIKWDMTGGPVFASFTIVSDRQPMEGTFYAKSGTGTYAQANGLFYVPDTDPLPAPIPAVPLPSAVWAGALLLAALGARQIHRWRQMD